MAARENVVSILDKREYSSAEQTQRNQDIFGSLFERSGICMATLDPNLRVLEANADLLQQFGRTAADMYGRGFCSFLHPSVQQQVMRQFARLTEGRRGRFSGRVIVVRPGDKAFAGELTGFAVPGEAGQVATIVVLVKPDQQETDNQVLVDPNKLLSDLDARILEGVAAGIPTAQLASKLYLSRQGVEYHVSTMLRKFKVPNRAALVSKAYSLGIFNIGSWPPTAVPDYVR